MREEDDEEEEEEGDAPGEVSLVGEAAAERVVAEFAEGEEAAIGEFIGE